MILKILAAFALVALLPLPVLAQDAYPNKPIRLIVPYAAGGGTDVLARPLAQRVSEALGQQMIVDNRPGASAIIGVDAAAKAAPDGYTLVITPSAPIVINPHLQETAVRPSEGSGAGDSGQHHTRGVAGE